MIPLLSSAELAASLIASQAAPPPPALDRCDALRRRWKASGLTSDLMLWSAAVSCRAEQLAQDIAAFNRRLTTN
jgi:hypothetical protein